MMQNHITQLHNTTPEELKVQILNGVRNLLEEFHEKEGLTEKLLTRLETAKLLSISLPTLRSYVKRGIIKECRVGSRVLYKWEDVSDAISTKPLK